MKVLSERIPCSSAAGLASELKIKSYSTLKIPCSSTAGSFNCQKIGHFFPGGVECPSGSILNIARAIERDIIMSY